MREKDNMSKMTFELIKGSVLFLLKKKFLIRI